MHQGRNHKTWEQPESWATGSTCQACLMQYHTHNRLIAHLRRVPRCASRWLATGRRGTPEEIIESRLEGKQTQKENRSRGYHDNRVEYPMQRVFGPSFCDDQLAPASQRPLPVSVTVSAQVAESQPRVSREPQSLDPLPSLRENVKFLLHFFRGIVGRRTFRIMLVVMLIRGGTGCLFFLLILPMTGAGRFSSA